MQTIKALAKALQVRVTDFLANRDMSLEFCHGEFRKNSKMNAKQQEFVKEEVEEYFGRFYQTVNILGGEVLPEHPALHLLALSDSTEENALKMRANKSGIINDYVAKKFYINANKAGWRKNEPSRAKEEEARLFYQLVYCAVTENEITAQKGAE